MAIEIRAAVESDARAISQVIIAALRTTNAKDYSRAVIEQVEKSFSPSAVAALIGKRMVFVALDDQKVIGTASLDGQVVRSVFVDPQSHGRGIGSKLMSMVEQRATSLGVTTLLVPSSITAERFYQKLGYSATRLLGYSATRLLGYSATRLLGYSATRLLGCS
jgi:predicted N-acetyltransferase YhbS